MALNYFKEPGRRIGIIGLGAGTLASYSRRGDYLRIYEINPLVVEIARTQFSYLRDSEASVEVVLGDARLSLDAEPDQRFTVFILDAFSGDSVPVHLLTREAFGLYLRHLAPGGVIAAHISNRYLDLRPVVHTAAAAVGMQTLVVESKPADPTETVSTWCLVSANEAFLREAQARGARRLAVGTGLPLWTDDYSNVFRLLRR